MSETTCGRCRTTKDDENFSPSYRGKNGAWCRACFSAYHRGEPVTALPIPERICVQCGIAYTPRALKGELKYCSRACNQENRKQTGRGRRDHLLRKFGISPDDYDRMLAEQGGGCALCGKRAEDQTRYSTYLHIDHDHVTGRIRGLLCDQHNLLLGRFNDDPQILRKAAAYLDPPQ